MHPSAPRIAEPQRLLSAESEHAAPEIGGESAVRSDSDDGRRHQPTRYRESTPSNTSFACVIIGGHEHRNGRRLGHAVSLPRGSFPEITGNSRTPNTAANVSSAHPGGLGSSSVEWRVVIHVSVLWHGCALSCSCSSGPAGASQSPLSSPAGQAPEGCMPCRSRNSKYSAVAGSGGERAEQQGSVATPSLRSTAKATQIAPLSPVR